MKKKILFITLLPLASLFAEPKINSTADQAVPDQQEAILDLVDRVKELEKKVEFLDKQIEVTSNQAFEKYGLYVVRPGDSLASIAKKNGMKIKEIMRLNAGISPVLEVAQIIRIKEKET